MPDAPAPAPVAPANAAPAGQDPAPTADPAAPKTPALTPPAAEAPAPKRKLTVKGKELEVDEARYHAYAQKAAAGEHGLEELAQARKQFEADRAALAQMQERLKTDVWGVLKEQGMDPDELAARRVIERYGTVNDPATGQPLTAEQQRVRELEAQLAERDQKDKTAAEAARKEAVQKAAVAKGREYRERFVAGLQKIGIKEGEPSIPALVMRMAAYQERDEDEGINHPPEVLAELVLEDWRSEDAAKWGRLSGEELLTAIGDDLVARIVDARVAQWEREQAQSGGGQPTLQTPTNPGRERASNGQYVSREKSEFHRRLGIG